MKNIIKTLVLAFFLTLPSATIFGVNKYSEMEIAANFVNERGVRAIGFKGDVQSRGTANVRLDSNGIPVSACINSKCGDVHRWGRPAPDGNKYDYVFIAGGFTWYFNI